MLDILYIALAAGFFIGGAASVRLLERLEQARPVVGSDPVLTGRVRRLRYGSGGRKSPQRVPFHSYRREQPPPIRRYRRRQRTRNADRPCTSGCSGAQTPQGSRRPQSLR